jgi:hypothetical protein
MSTFPAMNIWKAKVEPKGKFFAWLALYGKTLTADNMVKKNWPCDIMCPFCFCNFETAEHLLTECNYSEALWGTIANRYQLPSYNTLMAKGRLLAWVNHLANTGSKQIRKIKISILITFSWYLWKERSRTIFENKEQSVPQLAYTMQDELSLFHRALSILHG